MAKTSRLLASDLLIFPKTSLNRIFWKAACYVY